MKITGGKYRNLSLHVTDEKKVRPTSSKIREAIFSMIGQDLTDTSFLDAFGGSGIMGAEAFSRGAYPVVISEKNPKIARNISTQLSSISPNISVQNIDAIDSIALQVWDIVFLDPPYAMGIQPFLDTAYISCRDLIIVEMAKESALQVHPDWEIWKDKIYGISRVVILQKKESTQ